jgi:hypothetical protein
MTNDQTPIPSQRGNDEVPTPTWFPGIGIRLVIGSRELVIETDEHEADAILGLDNSGLGENLG